MTFTVALQLYFRLKRTQYLIQMGFTVDLSNSIGCAIVGIYITYLTLHYEIAAPHAPLNQFDFNE